MFEIFSKISLEVWVLIVFVVALLAKFVGTIIGDIQRSQSESSSLKDEEFGLSSRVSKFLPKEGLEPEEDDEDENAELLHRASFWHCCSCDAEFRLPDGEVPSLCPACGERLMELPVGIEEDAAPYICPRCGPYFLLDGDDSEVCPICGSDEVEEVSWVNRCLESWVCSSCDQEFIVPGTPTRCPCCGEMFIGSGGEVDDDVTEYTCSTCGKKTEMLGGEEMEHCPHCWKEVS